MPWVDGTSQMIIFILCQLASLPCQNLLLIEYLRVRLMAASLVKLLVSPYLTLGHHYPILVMVTSINVNRNEHHEACVCCSRPIRAGHPFIICNKCDCIMHKKCKTTSNIIKFREQTYCSNCIELYDIIRYNPLHSGLEWVWVLH